MTVALQLCLVDLLKSWGIKPSAVTSHSSGEIAAAYAVGALSLKEAIGVVYYRGELALKYQTLSSVSGAMMATGLSSEKANEYLGPEFENRVAVACINSPSSVTLSGDSSAIEEIRLQLETDGIFARKLKVPLAYHSHHMMPMSKEYAENLKLILPDSRSWTIPIFASPVTGTLVASPKALSPDHWVQNLTQPVLFAEAFETMCFGSPITDDTSHGPTRSANVDLVIEIGAHSTLSGPIRQILGDRQIPYMACLKRSLNAILTMQDVACGLLSYGFPVSIEKVNHPLNDLVPKYVPDLPSYPWNHQTRYWVEPRSYKEHKHRRFVQHELLGTILPGTNPATPTWRNFLRISDISWLADHKLDLKVILPGAGYVSMAIEAMRLLTNSLETTIKGYQLKDVDMMNALEIPDSSTGIEVQTRLQPCSSKELSYKGWFKFEIYSVSENSSWIQNCIGYICVDTDTARKGGFNRTATEQCDQDSFFSPGSTKRVVTPESIYADMRRMNLYHGPSFQNLIQSSAAGRKGITKFSISSVANSANTDHYVLHPTTLDSIFQSFHVCFPEETKTDTMIVAKTIKRLFVPCTLKNLADDELYAFTELLTADKKGAISRASVVPDSLEEPSTPLVIDGFYCQGIPRLEQDQTAGLDSRICATSRWELDIFYALPEEIKTQLKINLDDVQIGFERKIFRAAYSFIYEAVLQLEGEDSNGWQWHHRKFYEWMKFIVASGTTGQLAPGSHNWSKVSKGIKQRLIDDLTDRDAAGRLTCKVGQNLASIVRGEIMPLELMLEDNLLNKYYQDLPRLKDRTYKQLRRIAELYAVKVPGAEVLEIGAGTGGTTTVILEAFSAKGEGDYGTILGHYDFTDVSSGFFEAARNKLAAWEHLIEYKKLNIEADPIEQDFTPARYDLIVASMVIHATVNLEKTMQNVRKLLKPGGTMILVENTRDRLDLQLIFGTLQGWWLGEEPERKLGPNAPLETWDRVLRATGFSGVEFEISDCEEQEHQSQSVIVSSAISTTSYPSSISIIYHQTPPPEYWLSKLILAMEDTLGTTPTVQEFETMEIQHDRLCIFLLEMSDAFIHDIDEPTFTKLKDSLLNSLGILWVTCSSTIDSSKPLLAQSQGLLRTLKQEDSEKRYVQLDFQEMAQLWAIDKIPPIIHVLKHSFNYAISLKSIEWEYAVKDSVIYVPRFYPDQIQDRIAGGARTDITPESQPFWQVGKHITWNAESTGALDNVYFTSRTELFDNLPSGMIEIEPQAFGLNYSEIMASTGRLQGAYVGHECSGIVRRMGTGTESSGLRIGDRVCSISQGRFSNISRAPLTSVCKIPDTMSWEEAASFPLAYVTAYISLVEVAKLVQGEKILIHSATGDVGQAAIMLAQSIGAEIFVTCKTDAKREFLVKAYNIDPKHIFPNSDPSFAIDIMALTNGKGVDVILNSLDGSLLEASWHCIGSFGRFLELGKTDIEAANALTLAPFTRSASFTSIDILHFNECKAEVVQRALKTMFSLLNKGTIKLIEPISTYEISEMKSAIDQMQSQAHFGKLVVVPRPGSHVKVLPQTNSPELDYPDRTYLVVGGMGGIGRAIAIWMMENGANNILIVSRTASTHQSAPALCQKARANGCNLQIRSCDISDENAFLELLAECTTLMPPITGVIQAAMHLDVSDFK
jgi:NADPH:quinone reductase-like Zn-dependent oxidoreductase/SAM-dependent methyltransferase